MKAQKVPRLRPVLVQLRRKTVVGVLFATSIHSAVEFWEMQLEVELPQIEVLCCTRVSIVHSLRREFAVCALQPPCCERDERDRCGFAFMKEKRFSAKGNSQSFNNQVFLLRDYHHGRACQHLGREEGLLLFAFA